MSHELRAGCPPTRPNSWQSGLPSLPSFQELVSTIGIPLGQDEKRSQTAFAASNSTIQPFPGFHHDYSVVAGTAINPSTGDAFHSVDKHLAAHSYGSKYANHTLKFALRGMESSKSSACVLSALES